MGLDWNPGNKPAPGQEAEFETLFHRIENWEEPGRGLLSRLFRKRQADDGETREELVDRFQEISVPAYETLRAPRVGYDAAATEWARELYPNVETEASEADWLESMKGYYVVHLAPDCDGVPRYSNGGPDSYIECHAFRADFLKGCTEVIGEELLDQAYESRLPADMLAFGRELIRKAEEYAGRWCVFWAERGHVLDAWW